MYKRSAVELHHEYLVPKRNELTVQETVSGVSSVNYFYPHSTFFSGTYHQMGFVLLINWPFVTVTEISTGDTTDAF